MKKCPDFKLLNQNKGTAVFIWREACPIYTLTLETLTSSIIVRSDLVFMSSKEFNSDNFSILSEARNAQVPFVRGNLHGWKLTVLKNKNMDISSITKQTKLFRVLSGIGQTPLSTEGHLKLCFLSLFLSNLFPQNK